MKKTTKVTKKVVKKVVKKVENKPVKSKWHAQFGGIFDGSKNTPLSLKDVPQDIQDMVKKMMDTLKKDGIDVEDLSKGTQISDKFKPMTTENTEKMMRIIDSVGNKGESGFIFVGREESSEVRHGVRGIVLEGTLRVNKMDYRNIVLSLLNKLGVSHQECIDMLRNDQSVIEKL